MYLPSVQDMCNLIRKAGRGCFVYSANVARAYRQLPLDPEDWPLACFDFQVMFYTDLSLPFGVHWAAFHCQDITTIVAQKLERQGQILLNYIDDFSRVASTQATATQYFGHLQDLLARLGLQEAKHKATPTSQVIV